MSPANRQNRTLLYLLIIILLIFNLGLFYLWQKGKEERELANKQNTELEAELQRKANAIAAAESLLAQYQQDSATMAENNQQMSDELAKKKSEIARLTYLLKKEKYANKQTVSELEDKLSDLTNKLAILEEENARLKEYSDSLQNENKTLYGENTQLALEGKKLKNLAARLTTSEIKVETVKKQFLTGKEATTVRASRVKAFKINFSIAENNIAEAGPRKVYIKVTGPQGTTMQNHGQGGVVDLAEGKSTKFSYSTEVLYENGNKEVAGMVWEPSKKLTAGKYTVQLYTEGYLMGSSALTLR